MNYTVATFSLGSKVSPDEIVSALESVRDPEVDIGLVSLGMIYDISVIEDSVYIKISPTSGACPFLANMIDAIERRVWTVDGVKALSVNVVWNPPWTPDRISPEIRNRFTLDLDRVAAELNIKPRGISQKHQ